MLRYIIAESSFCLIDRGRNFIKIVEYFPKVMLMNKLRDVMFIKKINQEELERSGVAQSEISRILNNRKPGIHLKTAQKIAHALDSTVDELWPYGWWLDN